MDEPRQYIVRYYSLTEERESEVKVLAWSAADAKLQMEVALKATSLNSIISYIGPVTGDLCGCLNQCRCGVQAVEDETSERCKHESIRKYCAICFELERARVILDDDGVNLSLTSGACPQQYEGTVDGNPAYFRLRHGHWRFTIVKPGANPVHSEIEGDILYEKDGERADGLGVMQDAEAFIISMI